MHYEFILYHSQALSHPWHKNLPRHSPFAEGLFSKLTKSPTAEVSGNDFPNYTLIQFCTILTPFSASLTLSLSPSITLSSLKRQETAQHWCLPFMVGLWLLQSEADSPELLFLNQGSLKGTGRVSGGLSYCKSVSISHFLAWFVSPVLHHNTIKTFITKTYAFGSCQWLVWLL